MVWFIIRTFSRFTLEMYSKERYGSVMCVIRGVWCEFVQNLYSSVFDLYVYICVCQYIVLCWAHCYLLQYDVKMHVHEHLETITFFSVFWA